MKKEERVAKWVQTATGAWEQAAPKRLPVEPGAAEGEARANAEGLGAGGLAACGIAVGAAAGRTVAEQGRQGRQLAAEAAEAAATPTGDSQQRDAEAACARDWSRHWQAGAFAAWGWEG